MTERLAEATARIGSVRQLSAVITAMRGIAAARSREARGQLDGVRAYAGIVAQAISAVLALGPEPEAAAAGRERGHGIVALCAEQGFVGTFNEQVLDEAERLIAGRPQGAALLVVGARGLSAAAERGLSPAWSAPMAAHVAEAAPLANKIVEELYRRLREDRLSRVSVVHATPGATAPQITVKTLIPFDFKRFPPAGGAIPPLLHMPPARLLEQLSAEYVFAELCEAATLSFAAENEARMRAMIAARTNVTKTLDGLIARARQLRQEEITDEIAELSGAILDAPRRVKRHS